ncbi:MULTISPECIES: hypothetical protein [unclassified Streptomyces]|uniref:hypothetical protein n=1 Tax=unclassified Streptomyces TaxID=2593676 RepID=UPI000B8772EF|nr:MULTISPECIES: hypothetical protein [unclassified Streptomyces]MYS20927.1 hypothetical protein [Streptomyces sp. SID4948]
MPRGRHRHSQPLHRMLPPLTVAGCAAALAAASLFAGDTGALRVITAATALTACAGAALARGWDRSAGRRVAELETLRERDEWRTDERVAELETDLEESRELRGRLEKKLRGKRAELARLRTEHADLLRRYATAESERARALEARRRLQLEGAGGTLALATGRSAVGPAAFLKAEQALRELPRNAARQQAQRTVEEARRRDVAAPEEPQGKHAAAADGVPATSPAGLPVREHRLVPAVAAAVLPYAQPQRSAAPGTPAHRAIGGFDFFGTQRAPGQPDDPDAPDDLDASDEFDSSDGSDGPDELDTDAAAEPTGPQDEAAPSAEHTQAEDPSSEVIDLTAHDETEQLDMSGLRAQA